MSCNNVSGWVYFIIHIGAHQGKLVINQIGLSRRVRLIQENLELSWRFIHISKMKNDKVIGLMSDFILRHQKPQKILQVHLSASDSCLEISVHFSSISF